MGMNERLNPFSKQNRAGAAPKLIDAGGRELKINDQIVLNTVAGLPLFKIRSITPVLNPQAPPGLLQVDVISIMRFGVMSGQPSLEFIRTHEAASAEEQAVEKTAPTADMQAEPAAPSGPTLVQP